ncbi:hypothetical protein QTP86_011852 [Hemibagrus guttatus]|nr:hypothetical protein QTP86_011852 [Hemibagrus guttatus]
MTLQVPPHCQNPYCCPRPYSHPSSGVFWRRSSRPRPTSPHHPPVRPPSSTYPPCCPPKYCSVCMKHPVRATLPVPGCGRLRGVMCNLCPVPDKPSATYHVRLHRTIRRQRIQANRHRRPNPRFKNVECCKLSPRFIGPFRIIRQVNSVSYRLLLPPLYHVSPTFHVSLLKPACPRRDDDPPNNEPPPPLDIEWAPAYHVNTLLNSWCHWNRLHYLVDSEGYGPEEHSWVDADDILDPSLVEEFLVEANDIQDEEE